MRQKTRASVPGLFCFGIALLFLPWAAQASPLFLDDALSPQYDLSPTPKQPGSTNKLRDQLASDDKKKIKNKGTSPPLPSKRPLNQTSQSLTLSEAPAMNTRIGLNHIIGKTLQNNVAIAVQEFTSGIRREEILGQRAIFHPSLIIEGRAQENENQVASAFAAPDVSNTEKQNWKLGLKHKLFTGTEYELNYLGNRDETNSAFAGLNPQYTSRVEVNFTQPLLKNFGIDNNKKDIYIAKNNLDISDFDFKTKVIDVLTTAENTYWDLVFSHEDLRVKKQSVKRALDLERRVRAQVKVGTMAPIEILQAQSEVATREEGVLLAEKLISDTDDQLKNIMNVSFDSIEGQRPFIPRDTPVFKIGPKVVLNEAIREALENRPDYLSRKKELNNRNITTKFNENQLYPSLDLVGTFGLNGLSGTAIPFTQFGGSGITRSRFGGNYKESIDDVFSGNFKNWEVGLLLNYPIGNSAAKSKLAVSRLEAAQLVLEIKDLEKSIVVEVREASRQILTDIKRVHAARVARRLAEEKLKAEEKKFAVGLSTSFKVLEFQTDLAEEESKELKAIIDYRKSVNNFHKVKASTLNVHNVRMDTRSVGQ